MVCWNFDLALDTIPPDSLLVVMLINLLTSGKPFYLPLSLFSTSAGETQRNSLPGYLHVFLLLWFLYCTLLWAPVHFMPAVGASSSWTMAGGKCWILPSSCSSKCKEYVSVQKTQLVPSICYILSSFSQWWVH